MNCATMEPYYVIRSMRKKVGWYKSRCVAAYAVYSTCWPLDWGNLRFHNMK